MSQNSNISPITRRELLKAVENLSNNYPDNAVWAIAKMLQGMPDDETLVKITEQLTHCYHPSADAWQRGLLRDHESDDMLIAGLFHDRSLVNALRKICQQPVNSDSNNQQTIEDFFLSTADNINTARNTARYEFGRDTLILIAKYFAMRYKYAQSVADDKSQKIAELEREIAELKQVISKCEAILI